MSASVLDVPVTNDRVAVGILVHFLDVAAKRGAFALEESGKIMEAVKYLRGTVMPRQPPTTEEITAVEVAQAAATDEAAQVAETVQKGGGPAKPQLN